MTMLKDRTMLAAGERATRGGPGRDDGGLVCSIRHVSSKIQTWAGCRLTPYMRLSSATSIRPLEACQRRSHSRMNFTRSDNASVRFHIPAECQGCQ